MDAEKHSPSGSSQLRRTLKPSWVFALAVGSEIGWGAFILPQGWLEESGFWGTMLGFVAATFLILLIGLNYGYAIRKMPITGGGVYFAMAAGGKLAGFISGWALTLGYIGIVALNASAVTLVFRVAFPGLLIHFKLYEVAGWEIFLPEVIVSIIFVAIFAYLNVRGFEFSGRIQLICVILLLAAVVLVTVSLVWKWLNGSISFAPQESPEGVWLGAFAIIAIAPWAYVGFDSIPQLAGEFNFKPSKALLLLVTGIISASGVYMAMTLATALAMRDNMSHYADSAWGPAEAIADTIGGLGLVLMVLAVSAGVLTGLNGFTASASRVLLTLGQLKMLPSRFASVDQRRHTPVFSIVFVAIVCAVTPWFGRSVLGWVVDMTSVGIAVAYFFTSYFHLKTSLNRQVPGVPNGEQRNSLGIALGAAGCIVSVFFLILLLVPTMPGALGTPSLIALVIWIVLGTVLLLVNAKNYKKIDSKHAVEEALVGADT